MPLLALLLLLPPAKGAYVYHVHEGAKILIVKAPDGVEYHVRWAPAPKSFRRKDSGGMPLPTRVAALAKQGY